MEVASAFMTPDLEGIVRMQLEVLEDERMAGSVHGKNLGREIQMAVENPQCSARCVWLLRV